MKIYYVENLTSSFGIAEIEQFYLIDFGFGSLHEYGLHGSEDASYKDWDDFYITCAQSVSVEGELEQGKALFNRNAIMVRVL